MKSLGSNCPAEIVGVVASHAAVRLDELTKAERVSYEYLRSVVQLECGGDLLFQSVVRTSRSAIGPEPGRIASLEPEGREVFAEVVSELRTRMQI